MKHLYVFLCTIILTSCASGIMTSPTPPPTTVTSTIEPTKTAKPTETITITPTATIIPSETAMPQRELTAAYIEEITGELLGVEIQAKLITDDSLEPTITRIQLNDHYWNYKGMSSSEAIIEYVARTFYKIWLKRGGKEGSGPGKDISFDEYMLMWSEAQGGKRSCEDIQITVKANDLMTLGYKTEKMVIWPMCRNDVPDGIRTIDSFNIAFVNARKVENITIVEENYYLGYGTNIDGNQMIIYISFQSMGLGGEGTAKAAIILMSEVPIWIADGKYIGYPGDKELKLLLETEIGNSNGFKAAIQVFPQNEEEKRFNP